MRIDWKEESTWGVGPWKPPPSISTYHEVLEPLVPINSHIDMQPKPRNNLLESRGEETPPPSRLSKVAPMSQEEPGGPGGPSRSQGGHEEPGGTRSHWLLLFLPGSSSLLLAPLDSWFLRLAWVSSKQFCLGYSKQRRKRNICQKYFWAKPILGS